MKIKVKIKNEKIEKKIQSKQKNRKNETQEDEEQEPLKKRFVIENDDVEEVIFAMALSFRHHNTATFSNATSTASSNR